MATPVLVFATAKGGGSSVTTDPGNTTGATKLCVEVRVDSATPPTVLDNKGNTLATVGAPNPDQFSTFPGYVHTFQATGAPTVGTGHTFTATGPGGSTAVTISVMAVGPGGGGTVSLAGPVNGHDANNTSPWIGPAVTPASAEALLIACGGTEGTGASVTRDWSASSFTQVTGENDQNNFWGVGIATRAVSSIAAYTPQFTDNSSGAANSGFSVWAFTESGGGGSIIAIGQVSETDTALSMSSPSPTISSSSSSTPERGASLTIGGSLLGASQGTKQVRIGGVQQPITSWSDTSIVVAAVDRGSNKYGAAVNVEVWDGGLLLTNSYALTGLLPQPGWSYVDLSTPNPTASNRITTTPDLAAGDQVAYDNRAGQVSVAVDATFAAGSSVSSFEFEVWSSPDGWGASATQYLLGVLLSSPALYAARLVDTARRRRVSSYALSPGNWGTTPLGVEKWFAPELTAPVGSGSTIAIGQVSETDTAQPLVSRQLRAIGQPSETDTAQAVTARRTLTIGQPTETDLAQTLVQQQARAIGQVSEADSAQAFTARRTLGIAQASETDSALAATVFTAGVLGQPSETDTALAAVAGQRLVAGIASEADSALALTSRQTRALGIVSETDTALATVSRQSKGIGQPSEADSAQPVQASVPGSIGIASEADAAQPVVARQVRAIGIVTETDSAQTMALGGTAGSIGQCTETDAAQAFVSRLRAQVGQAQETDSALQMRVAIGRAIGQASETEQAFTFARRQLLQLGIALEIDAAQLFTYPGYGDELSEAFRYDVPSASLRYDIPAASLRFDVPSIGSAITIT